MDGDIDCECLSMKDCPLGNPGDDLSERRQVGAVPLEGVALMAAHGRGSAAPA